MECDEKEFGCLCKNVGGHFPCLFHGIYVKEYKWNGLYLTAAYNTLKQFKVPFIIANCKYLKITISNKIWSDCKWQQRSQSIFF